MKKAYINPSLEVIKITSQHQMLAGSVDSIEVGSGSKNPNLADGRSDDFDWDD